MPDRRAVVGLILGFVVGLVMGAFAFAQHPAGSSTAPTQYDAELIVLDDEAIIEAYKEQVRHLFATWMKDATGQPERARRGVNQARRAYADIMAALEHRRRQQQIPMPPARPQ